MLNPRIIITLLAAVAAILLDIGDGFGGSVGGSFAILLFLLVVALVVGGYDAWSMKRGVPGWIGSIIASIVGAAIGATAGSGILETAIMILKMEGRPGPLFLALMAIISLLGSWFALWVANRFR